MPVDLTMCLSLSQRQPLYQLLSMTPLKPTLCRYQPVDCPLRTSFSSPHQPSSFSSSLPSFPATSEHQSCFRRDGSGLKKNRVVFADAKGLALTEVRLFIPETCYPASAPVIQPSPFEQQDQQLTSNKVQHYKFRLGFPQPTLDFKAFLARLRDMHIQLESCNISEHSLCGKVLVSHVSVEQAVHIRVTFDSWRSHHDFPCMFLYHQRYGGSDVDVFAFYVTIPQNIDPKEQIEFCMFRRPGHGAKPQWDNNRGQNYKVSIEKDGSNGSRYYANPTLSKYRRSSWLSHLALSMPNSAELQYLQRSFSNRVETPVFN